MKRERLRMAKVHELRPKGATVATVREHDEHAEFRGHGLHVTNIDAWGNRDEFAVWINTEVSDFDGLCIGLGATRDAAVAQAVATLERAVEILQGGPTINQGGQK